MSWARYYSDGGAGECLVSDARFGRETAFEVDRIEFGGALLVGDVFGRTPRYVVRDVTKKDVRLPEDATHTFPPEGAVKATFQLPASLGATEDLKWIKLRLDPKDVFAVNAFAPELAKECGGRLFPAERKLEWMCWPGRYRVEMEMAPATPEAGQPYAWDLGWIEIKKSPEASVIRLPEGKAIRFIPPAELEKVVPEREAKVSEKKPEVPEEKPEPSRPPNAALAAGAWQECLKTIAEAYSAPQEPRKGQRPTREKPRAQAPVVRFGIAPVVMAAASAEALGEKAVQEWGGKLYGEDPVGKVTFETFVTMLKGDFGRLIPLVQDMDPAYRERRRMFDWEAAAVLLESAAGEDPERAHWRAMAGAFRALSIWRRPPRGDEATLARLQPFLELPAATRSKIVDALVSYKGPFAQRLSYAYPRRLGPLLSKGLVKDPEVARLVAHFLPDPRARAALANQIGSKTPSAVQALSKLSTEADKTNPEALRLAATGLMRSGKQDEAIQLLREAEPRLNYPGRQQIRRELFRFLHSSGKGPGYRPQYRRLSQCPVLQKELEAREADTALPAAERAMVRGDLHASAGDFATAAVAYGEALDAATDPAMRRIAWRCVASYDERRGWAQVGKMESQFRNPPADALPELGTLACTALAAGIVAGEEEQALEWAAAHLPALASTPGGSRALGFLFLWRLLSPETKDPAMMVQQANDDLAAMDDNTLTSLVDALYGQQLRIKLAGGNMDHKLAAILKSRQASTGWELGTAVVVAILPHKSDPRAAASLWRKVLVSCPPAVGADHKPGVPLTAEEQAAEAAYQKQCTKVTDACLSSLDRVEQRMASTVVREFVGTASEFLSTKQGKRFLPQAQALGTGALGYAGRHGLRNASQQRYVQLHVQALRRLEAPAATVDQYLAAVREAYPNDQELARIVAQLETESK